MTLRLITVSLLATLVAIPAAAAGSRPTGSAGAPPDALERAVRSGAEWHEPDAFMRYFRNHPNGTAAEHPDGFAGVAADVPRTGGSATESGDGSFLSVPVTVSLAGLAVLVLAALLHRRRLVGRPVAR
jgi:hypothetical protein